MQATGLERDNHSGYCTLVEGTNNNNAVGWFYTMQKQQHNMNLILWNEAKMPMFDK